MPLKIVLGDITKAKTTAIVNAANTSLLGGGGVDGAIHRAAGPGLLNECRMLHGAKTGQAKITKGGRLWAKYIIHTPGPCYSDGSHGEAGLLKSCYINCLKLALDHRIYDISFPSISTGIYRFPLKKAAVIAVNAIYEYPQMDVTMVCYDENTKAAYEEAKEAYKENGHSQCAVTAPYAYLPMKLAFQNQELARKTGRLVREYKRNMDILMHLDTSFHQMVCLDYDSSLPRDVCDRIYECMEFEDNKNPYPLTRLYPFLLREEWLLDMKEASYTKIDVTYEEKKSFCVEQTGFTYCPQRKRSLLCFYPYETKDSIPLELVNKRQCVPFCPDNRTQMYEILKSILFHGTVDLTGQFYLAQ